MHGNAGNEPNLFKRAKRREEISHDPACLITNYGRIPTSGHIKQLGNDSTSERSGGRN